MSKTITHHVEFRVYHATAGCDRSFCGKFATLAEAQTYAETSPAGLDKSMWDTARTAGHCAGMTAPDPDAIEADEPISWHGDDGCYCVVQAEVASESESDRATRSREMVEMLNGYGDRFAGCHPEEIASDWMDNDFDASDASDWCAIGVWDASTAAQLRDAVLTPQQVRDAADSLVEGMDSEERSEAYTDGDPIYAMCNGDYNADKFIAAFKAE